MTNNAIPAATPALNRLRAAAALIPIVESGFADGKILGDRAALMAAFCEWAIECVPTNSEEEKLVAKIKDGLERLAGILAVEQS
jgi:hypothetical protein